MDTDDEASRDHPLPWDTPPASSGQPFDRSARWQPPLGGDPAVVAAARAWARHALDELLPAPVSAELQADVEVLLSELTANAVRHAGGVTQVQLYANDATLCVAVHDDHPAPPVKHHGYGVEVDDGRGIVLVDAISTRWGVQLDPRGGKAVWLELPTTPPPTDPD